MSKFAVMPMSDYAGACDAIRQKTGETQVIKSGELTEKINKVYEQGQKNPEIDEKYLIEKTVSGKGYVIAEDVSEISHPLKVKLTSDTLTDFSGITLRRTGRNIINFPYSDSSKVLNGITFADKGNGYVSFEGTSTDNATTFKYVNEFSLKKGTYTYSIRFNGGVSAGNVIFYVRDTINLLNVSAIKISSSDSSLVSSTFTIEEDTEGLRIYVLVEKGVSVSGEFAPQLELGSLVSPYELYVEPTTYQASADGTVEGITSITPATVLTADEDVSISMTYNKSWGIDYEWNTFWDNLQENGNRVNYHYAFYRPWWNDSIFKPKYDMQPTNATNMFYISSITDLKAICKKQGITIDFSRATAADTLFYTSKVTNIGVVDLSNVTTANQVFYQCSNLENVDLVISNAKINWQNGFLNCSKLKNVVFEGIIGKTITIQHAVSLNKDSITSIINCLSDTTSSIAATFSKAAVNKAFETAENLADGTASEEWLNLISTKPNWTISLS